MEREGPGVFEAQGRGRAQVCVRLKGEVVDQGRGLCEGPGVYEAQGSGPGVCEAEGSGRDLVCVRLKGEGGARCV